MRLQQCCVQVYLFFLCSTCQLHHKTECWSQAIYRLWQEWRFHQLRYWMQTHTHRHTHAHKPWTPCGTTARPATWTFTEWDGQISNRRLLTKRLSPWQEKCVQLWVVGSAAIRWDVCLCVLGGGAFEHIFSFCFYSNMQLYVKSNILSMTIQTLSKWARCDLWLMFALPIDLQL